MSKDRISVANPGGGEPRPLPSLASRSPDETAAVGERLGRLLRAGDVVLLSGELGAGKTCLTQGIARGLGVVDLVCSPTFVLVGDYQGRERLYHADLYRLEDPREVAALELDRSTEDGVLVVEWPERAPQCLPRQHLLVHLSHDGLHNRLLELAAVGSRAQEIAQDLAAPAAGVGS
jgi:tRNA threonylcarbamoyladenosine biosynthesis protein TsaE